MNTSVENTPQPTATPVVDMSHYTPEITSIIVETIYEQNKRATLGGRDTFFWPDGNIGFVPLGDGQYRFFAANSVRSAVTVGTLDDPGSVVENNRLTIEGVDPQYAYASGGPVYRDPESGLLLMFYHGELHFGGNGANFHAAIGLAVSQDEGQTFQNLGIIIENNAPPDVSAPCCADVGGAAYTIKDGQFLVYFRDRQEDLSTNELAVATAPVEEVIEAAKNEMTSHWFKYHKNGQQPGLSGTSSPLELGNPFTDWFSVSYNSFIDRYVMVIATHDRAEVYQYQLYLTTSEDGYQWSPRVLLTETDDELTYPSIIGIEGDPLSIGETFYIYYVTTPRGVTRWHATTFHRMTVTLSGQMLEPTHTWDFDADTEGWTPLFDMGLFEVQNGALTIQATGGDPHMISPSLRVSGDMYQHIEIRMKVGESGVGQFFFTTEDVPFHVEEASVTFPVEASEDFMIYTVDMSTSAAWKGLIGDIRFDPIDQETNIEIDYIRLVP
ncbi:MAG: hypothetical protein R3307_06310 [Anaerolineales bacterium]|nr:hypothetical protein [Anaerolineales bacterium]